jgi:hypothetical protein
VNVGEDVAAAPRAAKKAKTSLPDAIEEPTSPERKSNGHSTIVPAAQAGPRKLPKVHSSDGEKVLAKVGQERPAKSVKHEKGTPTKQASPTTAGNARHLAMSAATGGSSSKATATAHPQIKKPVGQMEFFERRRYEMLNDPLGFDDCVHDTTKPIPRHAAKSFAQYRRREKGPPPPLEMSGAIGPAHDDVDDNGKQSAAKGSRRPESLAKEARKRAHQQKVGQKVQALNRGKSGSAGSAKTAEEGKGAGSERGKQVGTGKMANGKGKGKQRSWESTVSSAETKRKAARWSTAESEIHEV